MKPQTGARWLHSQKKVKTKGIESYAKTSDLIKVNQQVVKRIRPRV